jgi:hypothetical protein
MVEHMIVTDLVRIAAPETVTIMVGPFRLGINGISWPSINIELMIPTAKPARTLKLRL